MGTVLRALGSRNRIELLRKLQVARTIGELRLHPTRAERARSPERALAWQTVESHVRRLQELGLVQARTGRRGKRAVKEYVVNHARLFLVVEELRLLGLLQPAPGAAASPGTVALTGDGREDLAPAPPPGPALVLAGGPLEGTLFALRGAGPWVLGRAREAEVALPYDLFCSGRHAELRRDGPRHLLRDLGSRNGTRWNWRRLAAGEEVAVERGDTVGVGRSVLVFRGG